VRYPQRFIERRIHDRANIGAVLPQRIKDAVSVAGFCATLIFQRCDDKRLELFVAVRSTSLLILQPRQESRK
jgi:hypothetical protein